MHTSPHSQLALHDVSKTYDERRVIDRVSLTVKPGEKVGVVGDNGSGKSTLLRLLAGHEHPDDGEVTVRAPGGIGYLAQALDLPPEATVRDAVDLALADLRTLESAMHALEDALTREPPERFASSSVAATYATLTARYEARGGYEADVRVGIALHGLGLPDLDPARPLGTLSGGERARLALAATLASQPELLLLDEPTNDLDDAAIGWLEDHLLRHSGTVVVVTHDRVFLERLTTTVLEIDGGRVARFGNGYDGYLTAKAAERRRRLQEYEAWRDELVRNERLAASNVARLDAIPRKLPLSVFGHSGFRTRGRGHGAMVRIRNAKQRAERLRAAPLAPPPDPLTLAARIATGDGGSHEPAARLADVRVGERLDVPSLVIPAGGRVLVTGPNGAGKTTLVRVLAGELRPDAGSVRVPGTVGHLRQDEAPWPPGTTALQAFAYGRPGPADEHAEALLSLGLFEPGDLQKRVDVLSYGQRRRIELARLVSQPLDLLLLDEPTNHLSPALVEDLEEALAAYEGALVVVTHDRRMRSRFTGMHLAMRDGRIDDGPPR
ncbi:TlrC/CarA/OleB/SrmB family ABC-F type ribosomal protection protein [Mumia zhuanghuii]|uniref:TlrC/CarA/OleB/SrmB family ABC-F type ribosomal protection protein n=1 Tax=Mumia zhuanghuii TaxID=2585211 RepID=UPI003633F94B